MEASNVGARAGGRHLGAQAYWALFTLFASAAQTLRNAMQRELIGALGAVGASQVRFLFGLPFAFVFLALVAVATGEPVPALSPSVLRWATMARAPDRRDRLDAGSDAGAELRRGRRRDQDGGGAGRDLRAGLSRRAADVDPARRYRPRHRRGLAYVRTRRRGGGEGIMATDRDGVGFRRILRCRGDRISRRRQAGRGRLVRDGRERRARHRPRDSDRAAVRLPRASDRARIVAILAAWRPSLFAGFMGALASQFWFIAFALTDVARVRTLALVEVLFAQVVSMRLFREVPSPREMLGMALIVVAAAVLVSGMA